MADSYSELTSLQGSLCQQVILQFKTHSPTPTPESTAVTTPDFSIEFMQPIENSNLRRNANTTAYVIVNISAANEISKYSQIKQVEANDID